MKPPTKRSEKWWYNTYIYSICMYYTTIHIYSFDMNRLRDGIGIEQRTLTNINDDDDVDKSPVCVFYILYLFRTS